MLRFLLLIKLNVYNTSKLTRKIIIYDSSASYTGELEIEAVVNSPSSDKRIGK